MGFVVQAGQKFAGVTDQNVGNEIVVELVEKDHLVQEVAAEKEINDLLTGQVDTLKISLDYSKLSLSKAFS